MRVRDDRFSLIANDCWGGDLYGYMNLMYREKADVECDDLAARAEDLKTADGWVDKTLATKKAKAEKQPAQGITTDQSK